MSPDGVFLLAKLVTDCIVSLSKHNYGPLSCKVLRCTELVEGKLHL